MKSIQDFFALGILFNILVAILMVSMWGVNVYKFAKCNFEPSYKAEILYGVGIVSPTFIITSWIDIEDKNDVVIINK
jgi:hypothetical protein